MKPVYQHTDGTFGPPDYLEPKRFVVAEGLLAFHTPELREMFDVRVYLDPPEELRRHWKVQRDCSRRGYTTDQVLGELDRREPDSEAFIRPQRHHADIVVAFQPSETADQEHLDAKLTLRDSLTHPDLSGVVADGEQRRPRPDRAAGRAGALRPGQDPARARSRRSRRRSGRRCTSPSTCASRRLGEFTIGTELHRSDSLALVQLLILYHVLTARHLGRAGAARRSDFESSVLDELLRTRRRAGRA